MRKGRTPTRRRGVTGWRGLERRFHPYPMVPFYGLLLQPLLGFEPAPARRWARQVNSLRPSPRRAQPTALPTAAQNPSPGKWQASIMALHDGGREGDRKCPDPASAKRWRAVRWSPGGRQAAWASRWREGLWGKVAAHRLGPRG